MRYKFSTYEVRVQRLNESPGSLKVDSPASALDYWREKITGAPWHDPEKEMLVTIMLNNRLAELSTLDLNELEKIADSWKRENFDTLLAGFEPVDLDALLNPKNDPPGDDNGAHDDELDKGNVTTAICASARAVDVARLRAAIEFEFNLPYPDGTRMGLVAEAKAAYSKRLGVEL